MINQIFVSDEFLKLTEYRREEVIGRNCRWVGSRKFKGFDFALLIFRIRYDYVYCTWHLWTCPLSKLEYIICLWYSHIQSCKLALKAQKRWMKSLTGVCSFFWSGFCKDLALIEALCRKFGMQLIPAMTLQCNCSITPKLVTIFLLLAYVLRPTYKVLFGVIEVIYDYWLSAAMGLWCEPNMQLSTLTCTKKKNCCVRIHGGLIN